MARLVDSSVWVALFLDFDTLHNKAISLIEQQRETLYVPYCVLNESASVLTYKHSKEQANQFLSYLTGTDAIMCIDDEIDEEIEWFLRYSQRLSFTDISLLYFSKRLRAPILTFDVQLLKESRKMK